MTQKAAVEAMIGLDAGVFAVKTVAGLVLEAVKIDGDDMHTEMVLTHRFHCRLLWWGLKYDVLKLLSVVHRVFCLVIPVFEAE